MQLNVDLAGRHALVVGTAPGARRVLARYAAGGALVELVDSEELRRRLGAGGEGLPRFVVWVEGAAAVRGALGPAAAARGILVIEETPASPTPRGLVTLVGGGPGDAELMTLAGRAALAEADVVLYDRLGPRDSVAELAPGAELIDVGKTPGHHAVPQSEIEALLVDRALRGLRVVRLKGGDPFVFGRGGEEVLACRTAGVPFTVVPGVTSAISVPAAAGIPVTHRDVSRAFTVVSGHAPLGEQELAALVGIGGTLVVLMGVTNLPHLVAGLQRHGMSAGMPLAIIERGYAASQRATVSSVGDITGRLATLAPRSPAVIVIGEVVRVAADDPEHAARLLGSAAQLAT